MGGIVQINVANNNLTNEGGSNIIESIGMSARSINFSCN